MTTASSESSNDRRDHAHNHDGNALPDEPASSGYPCAPVAPFPIEPAAYAQYSTDMHSGMTKMMRDMHADPPSGDPDIDFLVMMIPHHAGAVEMARLVLRAGRDPLVREIAEKILAAQVSEIDGMRGRLETLRACAAEFPSLTGNRGS